MNECVERILKEKKWTKDNTNHQQEEEEGEEDEEEERAQAIASQNNKVMNRSSSLEPLHNA